MTAPETIPASSRRLHLLKELLAVQRQLVAATREQVTLRRRVSALENSLGASEQPSPTATQ
ncbi:hypothetical protein J9253_17610 [Thiothrix litoralis]|uniref:Uncharacterized protein n=1 Tax=Thiothrix litoralis TaxID=2891210 RepID=A0ABX7WQH5_9GAMM|nr:hypothetical protein [Thiothrix litoralis]QTR45785.1 hypothetical protein J9253_17610 [Thiothrix litoralis]